MICLAVETSCDETSIAVVEDATKVRTNLISSQIDVHQTYGGVVPEIASRKHLENINVLLDQALQQANVDWKDISLVAATRGPGLVGALLVGLAAGKSLALGLGVPFLGTNHLLGHIYANFIERPDIEFPFLALVVSGGHTCLVHVTEHLTWKTLGSTLDDAAGEAFDKVARVLGLGYPGGPLIDKLAAKGNNASVNFPRPLLGPDSLDFSFSGLKTAVVNAHKRGEVSKHSLEDLCASFQESVVDVLVEKTRRAVALTQVKTVVMAGGVACNSRLRTRLDLLSKEMGFSFSYPTPKLCTDNAAMIGCVATFQYWKGFQDSLHADVVPQWDL